MAGPLGLVIAIDGVIGAGKSTAARGVAAAMKYRHLDTGAMYRAVALAAAERSVEAGDQEGLLRLLQGLRIDLEAAPGGGDRILVDGVDVSQRIRSPEVSRRVGAFADRAAVRQALVAQQRAFGARGGVVAEGRDVGTVVFPGADLKIRMTASLDERVRRRHLEFADVGVAISLDQVRADIRARDREDAERDYGEGGGTRDAVVVATDGLTTEQVVARIVDLARQRGA